MEQNIIKQPWGWYVERGEGFFMGREEVVDSLVRYEMLEEEKSNREVGDLVIEDAEIYNLRHLKKYLTGHNGYIAGGYFKSKFLNLPIKDIDIFFDNHRDYDEALSYFSDTEGFKMEYMTQNSAGFKDISTGVVLDLVRYFGEAADTISRFDFTIAKFMYDGESVMYHKDFFLHLEARILVVDNGCRDAALSILRCARYGEKYGFHTPKATLKKLLKGLTDAEVLESENDY